MPLKIPKKRRYRRRFGAFGGIERKRDESVIDIAKATECYNFDFSSGALSFGYGTKTHPAVPADAMRYWVYRYWSNDAGRFVDQYLYQKKSGILFCYDSYTGTRTLASTRALAPLNAINYRLNSKDVLIMSCEGNHLMVWNGLTLREYNATPTVSSMALHYERMFVTSSLDPTKVFFSDDLDPTVWTVGENEGGFIELLDERGELNKVVSFGNYLYIFREHGISRVTAFGDQREFSVANLFVTAGRIYSDSIARCGAYMIFFASDGLYAFDGYDCKKILKNLGDGIFAPRASAFFDGKYYLSCSYKFADGEIVGCEEGEHNANALIVYDVSTGEYSLSRGLDISYLGACSYLGEDFLVACDGETGCVVARCGSRLGAPLKKHWRGPMYEFSAPDRVKRLCEIAMRTDVDCTVTVETEKKKKSVFVRAGDRKVRPNIGGRRISLSLDCSAAECDIKPPGLVYTAD